MSSIQNPPRISDIGQNIETLFKEWSKNNCITTGQVEYLNRMYLNMLKNKKSIHSFFDSIFKQRSLKNYINKFILEQDQNYGSISDVAKLNYEILGPLVKQIEKNTKLKKSERTVVQEQFSLEEISSLINRPIIDYKDLRIYDLRKLIRYNPYISFIYMINDKTNIPKNRVTVLEHTYQYEYGIQESKACPNNKMVYIRFYDMLVLDYDNITLDQVKNLLGKTEYLFRIYKTYKGFHVFLISHIIPYNNPMSISISKILQSDLMYVIYSKFNGYNVRLTPKINYDETITHEFVCDYCVGPDPVPIYEEFINILKIFDEKNAI